MGFIIPNMGMKQGRKGPGHPPKPGVADALFAKAQQRVLGVLFGNPGRSFYANEVIGLARSGTGAVQRELARLEAAGLVTAVRIGKQKHYQANPASPVFEELRTLVLKTSGFDVPVGREISRVIRMRSSMAPSRRERTRPPAMSTSWS